MDVESVTKVSLVCIGLFIFREIFIWLRYKLPKSVQCWFCQYKTQVPYQSSNSWYCPSCDQYNGFNKDGDYNRVIERQYDEYLNFTVTSQGRCKNGWKGGRSLCRTCNHNQEVKVKLLAAFVPLNEKNYDTEIEHYKEQLEKCYGLCEKCDKLLYTIFKNEREDYSVPRKLTAALRKIRVRGRVMVIFNLMLSICLLISAYVQLTGKHSSFGAFRIEDAYNYLNEIAPEFTEVLNSTQSYFPKIFNKTDFLILTGTFINIIAAYQTQSSLLTLNTLSWSLNFFLSKYHIGMKKWILAMEAISGIVSCLISISILLNINLKRRKSKVEPKSFQNSNVQSPLSDSSPNSFSKFEAQILHCNSSPQLQKIIRKTEQSSSRIWKKEDSLEPRIRSLNITGKSLNPKMNDLNFDFYHSENSVGGNASLNSAIFSGGSANSVYSGTNTGRTSNIKKRKNIVSPTRFVTDPMRPASNYSAAFSSPSVMESTRSQHMDDVDTFTNLPDDCMSCSGHSLHCRHFASYPPPNFPLAYYCVSPSPPLLPHYQGMYSKHMSPQFMSNDSRFNQFPFLYTISLAFLLFCNAALLYSTYSKNQ